MSDVPFSNPLGSIGVPADFARRAPSQSWEFIPLADSPEHYLWVWVKPAQLPQGLILRVPDETLQGYPRRDQLTMRNLLRSAGIDPSCVAMWSLQGIGHEGMNGTSPSLDQPIPDPVPGVDPNISVYVTVPPVSAPAQTAPLAATPVVEPDEASADLYECIISDWTAALKLERDLAVRRKQLCGMLSRLNTLNRDLSHDEKMFASNQDKSDWQDARRWLREVSARVSRYIKDHDIGEATSAAKRTWIEETYEQYILPRRSFDGVFQAQREFEAYRKLLQTLLNNMNTAHATASQEGERRAQMIMSRMSAGVRSARSKR